MVVVADRQRQTVNTACIFNANMALRSPCLQIRHGQAVVVIAHTPIQQNLGGLCREGKYIAVVKGQRVIARLAVKLIAPMIRLVEIRPCINPVITGTTTNSRERGVVTCVDHVVTGSRIKGAHHIIVPQQGR